MTKRETKRQGKPGATYTYNDNLVGRVELQADDAGGIEVTTDAEKRVADKFRLGFPTKKAAVKPKEV